MFAQKQSGNESPRRLWSVPKGEGFSTPAVVGERVILFHRVEQQEVVECLQAATGKRLWKYATATAYQDRYGFNGGPRCAPVSDGERVYTYGAEGKLTCLLLTTGQVLWQRSLSQDYHLPQNFFGVGSTPLLEGGHLIVVVGKAEGPGVVGLDKRTGKTVWEAGKGWTAGYAAPVAATVHGKRRVFAFLGGDSQPPVGGLLCLDPLSGKVDFTFSWRGRRRESVNAAAPLVIGNQVFISECYGAGGVLLDILPDGSCKERWRNPRFGTHFMTAVHQDGYLYGVDGHGPQNAPLVCVDLKTGKDLWREEPEWPTIIKTPQGTQTVALSPARAALLVVGKRCLMLGEYGHLAWLELSPKGYKELSRTTLFIAQETWGMPALSQGRLYVCQNEPGIDDSPRRLHCFALGA